MKKTLLFAIRNYLLVDGVLDSAALLLVDGVALLLLDSVANLGRRS